MCSILGLSLSQDKDFSYWKIKKFIYYVIAELGKEEVLLYSIIIAMEYTRQCAFCGTPCKNLLCLDCERKKHRASALVSQNVTKLKKLFEKPRFTRLWLSKFILYTNRVVYNLNELLKYKKAIEEIAVQI